MKKNVYSVGQVNAYIKNMFAQDFMMQHIYIKGEVSNCKYHSSGHIYFTMKDATGTLNAVMFAGYRRGLKFTMKEGDNVIVTGSVEIYERDGKYQLYAREIELDGAGNLYLRFEALKQELEEMGMFAPEYKKTIPRFARRIGVVTAPTGAAVQDIITGMQRHNDLIQLLLYPATVQGDAAVEQILYALRCAIAERRCDVLIIARGGGAAETLAVFNEERLLRAVAACPIPVISAVGHDVDLTLMDEVADIRAATPTAACQYCCVSKAELFTELYHAKNNLQQMMERRIHSAQQNTASLQRVLRARSPLVLWSKNRQRLNYLKQMLQGNMQHTLWWLTQQNTHLRDQLELLDPALPVERGYSITCKVQKAENTPIHSCRELHPGDTLLTRLKDGEVLSTITAVNIQKE